MPFQGCLAKFIHSPTVLYIWYEIQIIDNKQGCVVYLTIIFFSTHPFKYKVPLYVFFFFLLNFLGLGYSMFFLSKIKIIGPSKLRGCIVMVLQEVCLHSLCLHASARHFGISYFLNNVSYCEYFILYLYFSSI